MEAQNANKPRWIVARLGDDFNWWLDQTSEASQPGGDYRAFSIRDKLPMSLRRSTSIVLSVSDGSSSPTHFKCS